VDRRQHVDAGHQTDRGQHSDAAAQLSLNCQPADRKAQETGAPPRKAPTVGIHRDVHRHVTSESALRN
jgi:hypothetical protein